MIGLLFTPKKYFDIEQAELNSAKAKKIRKYASKEDN